MHDKYRMHDTQNNINRPATRRMDTEILDKLIEICSEKNQRSDTRG